MNARRALFILFPAILFVTSTWLILTSKPSTRASSRLEVRGTGTHTMGLAQIADLKFTQFNRLVPINTTRQLTSYQTVKHTLKKLNINQPENEVTQHHRRLQVRTLPGSHIIEIFYQDKSGDFAVEFLQELIQAENERQIKLRIDHVDLMQQQLRQIASQQQRLLAEQSEQLSEHLKNKPENLASLIHSYERHIIDLRLQISHDEAILEQLASEPLDSMQQATLLMLNTSRDEGEAQTSYRNLDHSISNFSNIWLRIIDAKATLVSLESRYAKNSTNYIEQAEQLNALMLILNQYNSDRINEIEQALETSRKLEEEFSARAAALISDTQKALIIENSPEITKHRFLIEQTETELRRIKERISELEVYKNSQLPPLIILDPPHINSFQYSDFKAACITFSGFGCLLISVSFFIIGSNRHQSTQERKA